MQELYSFFNDVNVSVWEKGGGGAGADPALVTGRGPIYFGQNLQNLLIYIYIYILFYFIIFCI